MSKKGIEDLINEIEIFVDSCKFQPLSSTKIVVPKEELMSMLKELRMKMPSEIERCQKIMRNKDAILSDAKVQAEQIISDASLEAGSLVNEHEIAQLAQIRAQEILAQTDVDASNILGQANADAENIRMGAMQYTQETLLSVENLLHETLVEETNKYNSLLDVLQGSYQEVSANRVEIENSMNEALGYTATQTNEDGYSYDQSEYNLEAASASEDMDLDD